MSDIYIPGVKSRFNTDKLIEDLMKVERIPKDRAEKQIESLQAEKGYWQEMGRRVNSLRESARSLYSFQNPFSERTARSSDETVMTATATRQAVEQERNFSVKQIAKADRFLSDPLDNSFKVDPGNYTFKIGDEEITLNYRGGSLKDFADVLSRRGRGKLKAGVVNVESGKQSFLIESLVTGSQNNLTFLNDSVNLARKTGITGKSAARAEDENPLPDKVTVKAETLTVSAGKKSNVDFPDDARNLAVQKGMILSFETSTRIIPSDTQVKTPPSGPEIPGAGSINYRGITIENETSSVPLPKWEAPPVPVKVDDMAVLSLEFTDGSSAALPLIQDSSGFMPAKINLDEFAGDKTLASLVIVNNNTNRDFSIRNVSIFNPNPPKTDAAPDNVLSSAQDAIVEMEGIEIKRPTNEISDLIPGVTIFAKAPSDAPVRLNIESDREAIKEAIVTFVGNYNRLVGELNVLTRTDERVLQELNYLTPDERTEMKKRLGSFSGDSMLNQFKNRLQQAVTGAYPTDAEQELSLLAQIGIGTDVRRAGATTGYNPSQLRGYLEIDEKILDGALQKDLRSIQQLFGYDSTGDLIADTGVAVVLDTLTKPYVETGGIISLRTGGIDSKINQEQRRIVTLDRQLEAKEAALQRQYGNMENAFNRMEKMGTAMDNFSKQANANNNR